MQFEIITTEEKLKDHLERDYRNLGFLCVFMYTILVFALCLNFIETDLNLIIKYYAIGLIILVIFLYILTYIATNISLYMLKHVAHYRYGKFKEIISEDGLTEVLDSDAVSLQWRDVRKIVVAHNFIIIKPKDRSAVSFLFRRNHFKTKKEYQEVVDTITKYYQEYKKKERKK